MVKILSFLYKSKLKMPNLKPQLKERSHDRTKLFQVSVIIFLSFAFVQSFSGNYAYFWHLQFSPQSSDTFFHNILLKKFKSLVISLLFLQNSAMGLNLMLMVNGSSVWPYCSFYSVTHFSQCFSLVRISIIFVSAPFLCPNFFRNRKNKS